ncbi:alpha-galactosidase [Actinomadura barringtoniae]|uniref:Alpha-galactosidase n=1 Tax=Actinomadura barringtoniae TaxID=1427535 RepID=A0A939PB87_9ACTN|nr:glycoside hydrolase family 36 protein [Actinomadura barringtoniae]MBO2449592.1 alpha-galactosidase [Actinomadura barringtoniae]
MPIEEIPVDPGRGRVYEHGWQSWSPTATYSISAAGERPRMDPAVMQTMCWRPGRPAPADGFQGEGLLVVDPGDGGPVRLFAAPDGRNEVPSIRARLVDDRLLVEADGKVDRIVQEGTIEAALAAWGDGIAVAQRAAPAVWCSWYHYFGSVTADDVAENLGAIGAYELPVDVIQIDDGWQAEIGDWLRFSERFAGLRALIGRIHEEGRRAGVWVAPFLGGARSVTARAHPEWFAGDAGHNWGQRLYGLDVTHPGARDHLRRVFTGLRELGFDYFKLDFLYAGALEGRRHEDMPGVVAYRQGLGLIREAIGPEPYVLGCGAPILPSVGLVDAMRVGPDVGLTVEPPQGDMSRPSQRAATATTVARAWQHGRLWVNDPDCLVARPAMREREAWARTVERYGGLRASSDRIRDLDEWGLETTRRLLSAPPSFRPG